MQQPGEKKAIGGKAPDPIPLPVAEAAPPSLAQVLAENELNFLRLKQGEGVDFSGREERSTMVRLAHTDGDGVASCRIGALPGGTGQRAGPNRGTRGD